MKNLYNILKSIIEKLNTWSATPDWNQNDPNQPDYVKICAYI